MTLKANQILLTGGSGRLGSELIAIFPGIVAPSHSDLDVTIADTINAAVEKYRPKVLVHAAAYTNVREAENQQEQCWNVNVTGTQNIVESAKETGIFLVHISTDYVFEGTRGNYKEDDPLGPTCNYYASTKLEAENCVRALPDHLVVRTSFRPREWPYEVAFTDVFTSQDYVDIIAPEIALAIKHFDEIPYNTLHIATERKSVFELAKRRKSDVQPGSKENAQVTLPDDISLDISRWQELTAKWKTSRMPGPDTSI